MFQEDMTGYQPIQNLRIWFVQKPSAKFWFHNKIETGVGHYWVQEQIEIGPDRSGVQDKIESGPGYYNS